MLWKGEGAEDGVWGLGRAEREFGAVGEDGGGGGLGEGAIGEGGGGGGVGGFVVEECGAEVQRTLNGHLQDEEHAEDFVADALFARRNALGEDVAQREEPLAEVVVGACEVECREGERVDGIQGGKAVEMLQEILLQADAARLPLRAFDVAFKFCAEFAPESGQAAQEEPRCEDNTGDVAEAAREAREAQGIGFDLQDIAIFFAEGAVSEEGREAEVEEIGEVVSCGGVAVGEAGTEEGAQDEGGVGGEGGCYVGVFLVGAEDVWGGGEGVFHGWRTGESGCRHGEMGGWAL